MDIEFDASAALQILDEYPKRVQSATVRALNRALTTGRATVARLVAADMKLPVGAVKDEIRVEKATASTLSIRLRASLKRIPIYDFDAKRVKAGVSFRSGAGGKTRSRIPGGFIATMPTGHTGVFTRRGKARLPIDEKFGPSIGHVFIKHQASGIDAMREAFNVNLAHELEFASTEGGA